MLARLVAPILTAIFTAGCIKGVGPVRKVPLIRPNPVSYTFPLPLAELRTQAIAAFSIKHQVKEPPFGPLPAFLQEPHYEGALSISVAGDNTFGSEVFRNPLNRDDIFLHTFGAPLWPSPVYRGWREPLPFLAEFHVHFSAEDASHTRVTVTALHTEVFNGMSYGWGPCGPGWGYRRSTVKPTTVEEYTIIRYLGKFLGTAGMPEVSVPAA